MWQRKSKTSHSSSKSLEQTQSSVGRFYAPEYELEELRGAEVVSAKKQHWWDDDYVPVPDESGQGKVKTLGALLKTSKKPAQTGARTEIQAYSSALNANAQDASSDVSQGTEEDGALYAPANRANSRYQSEVQAAKQRKQQRLQQAASSGQGRSTTIPDNSLAAVSSSLDFASDSSSAADSAVASGSSSSNEAALTEEVVAELHDAMQYERVAEAQALVQRTSYQERLKQHQQRKQPEASRDLTLEPGNYASYVAKRRAKLQGAVAPTTYAEQVKFMQYLAATDKNFSSAVIPGTLSAAPTSSGQGSTYQSQVQPQLQSQPQHQAMLQSQGLSLSQTQEQRESMRQAKRWDEAGFSRLESAEFGGLASQPQIPADGAMELSGSGADDYKESVRDIIKRKMAALRAYSEAQKLVRQRMFADNPESSPSFNQNADSAYGNDGTVGVNGAEAIDWNQEDTLQVRGRWWKQRRGLSTNLSAPPSQSRQRAEFSSAPGMATAQVYSGDVLPAARANEAKTQDTALSWQAEDYPYKGRRTAQSRSASQSSSRGVGSSAGRSSSRSTGCKGKACTAGSTREMAAPKQPVALDANEVSSSFGNYFDYGRKVEAKDADAMTSSFGNYHEGKQRLDDASSVDEVVSSFGSCFEQSTYSRKSRLAQRKVQSYSVDDTVSSFGDVLSGVKSGSGQGRSAAKGRSFGQSRGKGHSQYARRSQRQGWSAQDADSSVASFGSIGSANNSGWRKAKSYVAPDQSDGTDALEQQALDVPGGQVGLDEHGMINGQSEQSLLNKQGVAGSSETGTRGQKKAQGKQELPEDVQAFNAIVQMLTRREHSQTEIRQKLKDRFSPEALELALQRSIDCGYQSDARHAEMLVRHMEFSGYGPQKLWVEAKRKGADEDEVKRLAAEVDWDALAYKVLSGRYSFEQIQDYATRNKALAFLARRGFSASSGYAALQRLQNCAENE